jgi:energy-coupling factor transport system permease protein
MRFVGDIGQYVPVDSPVHRMDAAAKIVLVAAFAVSLFAVGGFAGLAVQTALVTFAVGMSRVPLRVALRGIRAVSVILLFTLVLHAVEWRSAEIALVRLGPLSVTADGLADGLFFAWRIVLLVVGTSLVALTTPPVGLTDGLERLLKPLAALRVPVHDLAMMLSIALRFIPATVEEAEKVIAAQVARGARIGQGGPVARIGSYVPVLVPLFVGLFRRADELAVALDARCYRGAVGRTRYRERRMRDTDWAVLAAGVALLVAVAVVL